MGARNLGRKLQKSKMPTLLFKFDIKKDFESLYGTT
jgi:hypothetical protein